MICVLFLPSAVDPNVVGYCLAQYDYSPMEPNQIALRVGDRIAILNKSSGNQGWWKGRLNGKVSFSNLCFTTSFNPLRCLNNNCEWEFLDD